MADDIGSSAILCYAALLLMNLFFNFWSVFKLVCVMALTCRMLSPFFSNFSS